MKKTITILNLGFVGCESWLLSVTREELLAEWSRARRNARRRQRYAERKNTQSNAAETCRFVEPSASDWLIA